MDAPSTTTLRARTSSPSASGEGLGHELEKQDEDFLHRPFGLESGVYFDSEHYGTDRLLTGRLLPFVLTGPDGGYRWLEQVSRIPIPAKAQANSATSTRTRSGTPATATRMIP